MIFSKSQYHDLIQYAINKGLNPKIFKHEVIQSETRKNVFGKIVEKRLKNPYSIIKVKNTEYYFNVELFLYEKTKHDYSGLDNPSSYRSFGKQRSVIKKEFDVYFHVNYCPGATYFKTKHKRVGFKSDFYWELIFSFGKTWIDNLVDEIHAIEELAKINFIPDFFSENRTSYNSFDSYSGEQGEAIRIKLRLLKSQVREEIDLNEEQARIINEKLDTLILKVDELDKFDFRSLFFGILTNLASSVIYDNAPTFWKIVTNIFGSSMIGDDGQGLLV